MTSLPGSFGIGDLGPAAFSWIDTLASAKQVWWQLLPVGPTGFGDSPYQSPSSHAGNPNLISPELLRNDNLVSTTEMAAYELPAGPIDYNVVVPAKRDLVSTAFKRFRAGGAPELRAPFQHFCTQEAGWLNDFALFLAIKENFDGLPWWQWPRPLAFRDSQAIQATSAELDEQIQAQRFGQFLFFRQWTALRDHATKRGVKLFGDMPIYVADDSADVWCHPDLFMLDGNRRPICVAGVPPDYFSESGQLWGNPLYNWDAHRQTGFSWWIDRMKASLKLFDQVRIDHFRGIEAFWAVPAGDATAVRGQWLPGPGDELLNALSNALGQLPVVAEDLGFITPQVDELRERFGLPGMRILQFAFGGAVENRFLPHRFTRDLLVTTGTHDNDTTRGWFDSLTSAERRAFGTYATEGERDPVWSLIRLGWSSVAEQAIAPLQDLLELGSSARMNVPGTASGNWRWRANDGDVINPAWLERLAELSQVYERTATTPT
jgi:4-alpha-glucanotransferase